jgi:hypothetical protein
MEQTNLAVILASTRQGRFGERPARWMLSRLQQTPDVAPRLLDLRD